MLSRIDKIVYPDRCEVIQWVAPQRYVYPIFKNASSSLCEYAQSQNYKVLLNQQLHKLESIDIFLRDPLPRFLSGLNTFVYNTKLENQKLHTDTILYFAENYLFLNRHYAPQFSWIYNLSRYINPNCRLNLKNIQDVKEYTPLNIKPLEQSLLREEDTTRLIKNVHNKVYLTIDSLLLNLVGKEITYSEIVEYIKQSDTVAYNYALSST